MTALRVEISIAWIVGDVLNSKMREERRLSSLSVIKQRPKKIVLNT